MVAPFDIFRADGPGGILWIEAVAELEAAKARVGALMQTTPCEYLIFSQKTGHKISIKPTNGVSVRSVHLDEVWVDVEDGPKWTPTEVSTWGIDGHFGASSR